MWDKVKNIVFVIVIQILIVFGMWVYFKSTFGIYYKHKYINQLEATKTEFKERLNVLEMESLKVDTIIKVKTKKFKNYAIRSEKQRKKIEKDIDDSNVSDNNLEQFLSRYPDAPEPP